MQELGVQQGILQSAITTALQPSDQTISEIGLSQQTLKVIESAVDEARHLQHTYVGTQHLLLGILNQEESYMCDLLRRQGVSLGMAHAKTEHYYSQGISEQVYPHSSPLSQPESKPSNLMPQTPPPVGTVSVSNTVAIDSARQQLAVTLTYSLRRTAGLFAISIAASVLFFMLLSILWLETLASTLANTPVLNWQPLIGWYPFLVLIYFVLIITHFQFLNVPIIWYINFVIPRRYGLHKGTTWHWLNEFGRSLLITYTQIWLFVEACTLLLTIQPQTWWAWAALLQLLYTLLIARFIPFLLSPFFKKIEPLSEGELTGRFNTLLTRLHLPACGLFVGKVSHITNVANAFCTGWGKGSHIILTDTLIQNLTLDETEVILAHEMGHLVHHDIWTRLLIRGLYFLGIFCFISLYQPLFRTIIDDLILLKLLLIVLIFVVFAGLAMYYYRHQEYRADEFALQATGNIEAFKSAITRLTNINLIVATSTKYAHHPVSHPTLVERLQHADEFAARSNNNKPTH